MRFVSYLCSMFMLASALLPGALHAAGLYEDLPAFFSAADTSRTRLLIRQAELERGGWRASLLEGEVDFRKGRRCLIRLGLEFPTVRWDREIEYGVGDIMLRAAVRVFGDTLETSGLFFRSDVRIPTGGKGLRPFCDASLDGGAGLEARFVRGGFALRGAALYTLAGVRLHEADFENDNNLILTALLGLPIPRVASVTAAACVVRFNGGDSREIILCSAGRNLSAALALGVEGAFEVGKKAERIFDSSLSISIAYRFPTPARPVSRKSDER